MRGLGLVRGIIAGGLTRRLGGHGCLIADGELGYAHWCGSAGLGRHHKIGDRFTDEPLGDKEPRVGEMLL